MIQITETAANQIQRLKTEEGQSPNAALRVEVIKGGCSGMSYKLSFAEEPSEQDKSFTESGQTIVVDKTSYLYLLGMTLDFSGGLNGQGFVFSNPNASRTCSCGSSFGV